MLELPMQGGDTAARLRTLRDMTRLACIGVPRNQLTERDRAQLASPEAQTHLVGGLVAGSAADAVPLGEIFGGLAELDRIPEARALTELSTRPRNVVRRAQLGTWAALAAVSIGELRALPNAGKQTLALILSAVVRDWVAAPLEALTRVSVAVDDEPAVGDGDASSTGQSAHPVRVDAATEHALYWTWLHSGAETLDEVLATSLEQAPPDVVSAIEALRRLPLSSLVDGIEPLAEPDWQAFLAFDEREWAILTRRVFPPEKPETLQVIGDELEVTRERVRQIETTIKRQLTEGANGRSPAFRHIRRRLVRELAEVQTEATLVPLLEAWVRESSAADLTPEDLRLRTRVLRWISGPWAEWHGLLLSGTALRLGEHADAVIAAAAVGEPVEAIAIDEVVARCASDAEVEAALDRLGLRRVGGTVVRWGGTLADKAVAVLNAHGDAMSIAEIHAAMGPGVNLRSMANVFQVDPRAMRRDRDRWGLREWGGEEYRGIIAEIELRIDRAGGCADLEAVVEEISTSFGVAEGSVRSYAAGPKFCRGDDGTIRRAASHDEPQIDATKYPLEPSTDCFLRDGRWHLRVPVTTDVLRGSGGPIRRAVAVKLGVPFGGKVDVEFGRYVVPASWANAQPIMGSLLKIVRDLGGDLGGVLVLPLDAPSEHEPFIVRAADTPDEGAAAAVGAAS